MTVREELMLEIALKKQTKPKKRPSLLILFLYVR